MSPRFRKSLLAFAALIALAFAVPVSAQTLNLFSGPIDPSNSRGVFNLLISNINAAFGWHTTYYVTAETDVTSSTTLTNITGLQAPLVAGGVYAIHVYLPVTATSTPGAKFALGTSDTLTATSISVAGTLFNTTTPAASSVATALGTAVASVAGAGTYAVLDANIQVNAAGTLVVQIAQNTSNATATSALINGYMRIDRIK